MLSTRLLFPCKEPNESRMLRSRVTSGTKRSRQNKNKKKIAAYDAALPLPPFPSLSLAHLHHLSLIFIIINLHNSLFLV